LWPWFAGLGLVGEVVWMSRALDDVGKRKSGPFAEAKAAAELVGLARERGLSLTGLDGLLK